MADEEKKKPGYQVSKTYEVSGDSLKKKTTNCPKCGEGFRMAQHKNRKSCGKCNYTEFS